MTLISDVFLAKIEGGMIVSENLEHIDGLVQDCSNSIANAHWSYCSFTLSHQYIL